MRPDVRADTWVRDGGRCRCPCHRVLDLTSDAYWQHANIHERTGGANRKNEAIDTSLRSTITLAAECHEAVERNRLKIEVVDEQKGFNGPVIFSGRLASGAQLEPYMSLPTVERVIRQTDQTGDESHDDSESGVGDI